MNGLLIINIVVSRYPILTQYLLTIEVLLFAGVSIIIIVAIAVAIGTLILGIGLVFFRR